MLMLYNNCYFSMKYWCTWRIITLKPATHISLFCSCIIQRTFTYGVCIIAYHFLPYLRSYGVKMNSKYFRHLFHIRMAGHIRPLSYCRYWGPAVMFKMGNSTLLWRHNEPDGVSNHQPHDCWLNRLFSQRSKKTSTFRVTGLCAGKSPETGEFPAQMASNAENVSIWWRHHEVSKCMTSLFKILMSLERKDVLNHRHWTACSKTFSS